MQLALPHFRVTPFAFRLASTVGKAQFLASQFIGLIPSATETARTIKALSVNTANRQNRRASILDTVIVVLGLASIILTGLMVGRVPGTFSFDSIWKVIFGLCSAGMVGCGARLFRLARLRQQ